MGVFRVKGWGATKFGMFLETKESFWRDVPGFCRDIPELPKSSKKKLFAFNFGPEGPERHLFAAE